MQAPAPPLVFARGRVHSENMPCFLLAALVTAERCGGNGSIAEGGPCRVSGPHSPAEQPSWLAALKNDRAATVARTGYRGRAFELPELKWSRTAYIQPQMHPFDLYFYTRDKGFTPDFWLNDLEERYGGIDAALVWPTYPNLGCDDRNQFDMFRALPGGLHAISSFTAALQRRGHRILWAYLPWDVGTRREGVPDERVLVDLLQRTGGAGFNGDSIPFVPESYFNESLQAHYPVALQAEGGARDQALDWSTLGWGYWGRAGHDNDPSGYNWTYETVPLVDRFKFVTSGRWLTNICERYAKNKTDDLQLAFFNGDGYETWENVWGAWNGIVPRDAEAIRRIGTMLRFWGAQGYLNSPQWEPHATVPRVAGVFASRWPHAEQQGSTLYTIINRSGKNLTSVKFDLPSTPQPSAHPQAPSSQTIRVQRLFYDCYHGVELHPVVLDPESNTVTVEVDMEAGGFGCIVELPAPANATLRRHLDRMQQLTSSQLWSFDDRWRILPQKMVPLPRTPLPTTAPDGMVWLPRTDNFTFIAAGVEIEGSDALGVDVQFPWETSPRRRHEHCLAIGPLYIDRHLVSCADYARYLQATGYQPKDRHNWLRNWAGNRSPGWKLANVPVTYVSLGEARLYCLWRGARLPHAFEWQYAAQGLDNRTYPWGDRLNQSRYPTRFGGHAIPGAVPIGTHSPDGDSPFGVADLVGNVWQWTDEFVDEHTRRAILRGGSNYRPRGSAWYFPQALELHAYNLYLLMDDSFERVGTIGFRCVVDA